MHQSSITPGMERLDARMHDRVRRHTARHVNEKIDRISRGAVERGAQSGRHALLARLREIDREWDVDRALMANFAIVGAITLTLARRRRGWRNLLRAQQLFLFLHALVGWCPPLPVFRRLGFRTAKEIAMERAALVERLRAFS